MDPLEREGFGFKGGPPWPSQDLWRIYGSRQLAGKDKSAPEVDFVPARVDLVDRLSGRGFALLKFW